MRKFAFTSTLLLSALPASVWAAGDGVSPKAYELGSFLGLPITNAMVTSWVISLILIFVVRALVGKPTLVPSAGQAMVEGLLGGIREIMEPIVGKKMIQPTFPLLMGLFLIILIHNWSGLMPGVGTFGFYDDEHLTYFFRPQNSDLNGTLALAAIGIIGWLFYCFKYAGAKVFFLDVFGNKADKASTPKAIYLMLFPMFFAVGFIELISFAIRPVSLSLRLFGNVFGGETLLHSMITISPWLVPIPFYFFEFMVGLVQAIVFTLLIAVYIGLICNHGDEDHAH